MHVMAAKTQLLRHLLFFVLLWNERTNLRPPPHRLVFPRQCPSFAHLIRCVQVHQFHLTCKNQVSCTFFHPQLKSLLLLFSSGRQNLRSSIRIIYGVLIHYGHLLIWLTMTVHQRVLLLVSSTTVWLLAKNLCLAGHKMPPTLILPVSFNSLTRF